MTQPFPKQEMHPAGAEWVVGFAVVSGIGTAILAAILVFGFLFHEMPSLTTKTPDDEITYAVSHAAGWIIVTLCWLGIPALLLLKQICAVLTFRHAVLLQSLKRSQ